MDNTIPRQNPSMANPVRVAWGVLLVAFAVFCFTCILSMAAVYLFFFESTVPMTVIAQPSRNSGGITGLDLSERVLRGRETLTNGNTTLRAATDQQVTLEIRDPHTENRLIALITLKENSELDFRIANRPRFEWSSSTYRVDISNAYGDIDVFIPADLPRTVEINVITKQSTTPAAAPGALVKLGDSGLYHIDVTEERVQVTNYNGAVVIADPNFSFGRDVPDGSRGTISHTLTELTLEDIIVEQSPVVNLLENPEFNNVFQNLPTVWSCGNLAGTSPRGDTSIYNQNGRNVLQLVRGDNASNSGGTFCRQGLNTSGERWIEVTDYDYLEMRISLFIQYQSLQGCGERGSECPLMVRMDYVDMNGNPGQLFYGFYAVPPREDYLPRCESCWQDHIRIGEQVWFTFESGNLIALFRDEGTRPAAITSMYFYASGHQYDTRVGEVSLFARDSTPTTESDAGE